MNVKATLVGLLVLALVATGVIWVRLRTADTEGVPAGQSAPASAAGDDALPDVTSAEGTAEVGAVRITLSLTPNRPMAFSTFRVRVRADANGAPAAIENGRVSFEMAMPMGGHRYALVPGEKGWQEAAVVLPT